ncbi:MAG TPA: acyl carrier protein [Kiritimatiellia bacterium]|mgnify:CR=1 FL=1|nr:acyl carrier protein [Kiritimatiellia bacterium]
MTQQHKVREIFSGCLNIPLADIQDELAYNSRPEWDSVAHMALVARLDQAFNIMMETDDVINLSSVAKAYEILRKYGIDV